MDKRSPATGSVAHGERGGAEQNAHGAGRGGGRVLDHPAKRDAQGRLPANHQAERSLLGSMLIAPDEVLDRARTEFGISADSFDDLAHSRVWRSAEELVAASVPLTIETVTNHLYEHGTLGEAGGSSSISALFNHTSLWIHWRHFAEIVRHKALLRRRLKLIFDMGAAYCDPGAEVADLDAYLMGKLEEDAALFSRAAHPPASPVLREPISARALQHMELPRPRYTIDRFMPRGLVTLAATHKAGKSFLCLNLSVSVALDLPALGEFRVDAGDVLYLALEDRLDDLRERLTNLMGPEVEWPERLQLLNTWPRLDLGGMGRIERWARSVQAPRLVIVDVLEKVRPPREKGLTSYQNDYAALTPLKALADAHDMSLLVITHTRKQDAADVFDTMQDSAGFGAVADAEMILKRGRGEADATLHVTGRKVREGQHALRFEGVTGRWVRLGDAATYAVSTERRAILELVAEEGPMTPGQIAERLGKNRSTIKNTVYQMANPKHGRPALMPDPGGRYHLADERQEDATPIDRIDHVDRGNPHDSG